jgi:pimeloyl-ACP methyl ester carboxylesterase
MPSPNAADGIRNVSSSVAAALEIGDQYSAAEVFIDYWAGEGSWKRTPENQKAPIALSMRNAQKWWHALFNDPTPISAFRSLDIPVLYMTGNRSTKAAHGVAKLLTASLPQVEVIKFEDIGHMGPVTDPGQVNNAIAEFLSRI